MKFRKILYSFLTFIIIITLIGCSISNKLNNTDTNQQLNDVDVRIKNYEFFIETLRDPNGKIVERILLYAMNKIVSMTINSFIPNNEVGLSYKFIKSLYDLITNKDVNEINKLVDTNEKDLKLLSSWEQFVLPDYIEGGAFNNNIINDLKNNCYDKYDFVYDPTLRDMGENNLIGELNFILSLLRIEKKSLNNNSRLDEIRVDELNFLNNHLKNISDQLINRIYKELGVKKLEHIFYEDLNYGQIFYIKNIILFKNFIDSEINYLSESKVKTTSETISLAAGRETTQETTTITTEVKKISEHYKMGDVFGVGNLRFKIKDSFVNYGSLEKEFIVLDMLGEKINDSTAIKFVNINFKLLDKNGNYLSEEESLHEGYKIELDEGRTISFPVSFQKPENNENEFLVEIIYDKGTSIDVESAIVEIKISDN